MARTRTRTGTLTQIELEIMRIVWRDEETTVPELQQALETAGRPVALPTIRTMLGILEGKGYVTRRTGRRRHVYRAAVSAGQAQKGILKDIIERAFEGSALSLVTALVNGEMVSKKELRKVAKLIENREKEGGK